MTTGPSRKDRRGPPPGRRAAPAGPRHRAEARRRVESPGQSPPSDPRRIALAATLACLLEASAEKAGNVTPTRSFADTAFLDFVWSGLAAGPVVAQARPGRVGESVYRAVMATRRVTPRNTNLGMLLLLAPLAAAASLRGEGSLRDRVRRVLAGLGRADASWVYRAIRRARPGGLGRARVGDVRGPPRLGLREAMALAADRDAVAAEYVRDFAVTFDLALPALRRALARRSSLLEAVARAHLDLLARVPDTLIARKAGHDVAREISAQARAVLRAGGPATDHGRAEAERLDQRLRDPANRLNPGTTADLLAAALFCWLLEEKEPLK